MSEVITINFPEIGEGVVEGEVIEWLKQENDQVNEHEPVVVVMTDKATVELPSPYSGKLTKQYYKVGEVAFKDKPIYDIELAYPQQLSQEHAEQAKHIELKTPDPIPLESFSSKHSFKTNQQLSTRVESSGKALAAPPERKLAKDLQLDINQITGTGKDGRVTKDDIIAFQTKKNEQVCEKGSSEKLPSKDGALEIRHTTPILHWDDDEEFPIRGLRKIISEKMSESKQIIPHFSFFDHMDASRLIKIRENIKMEAEKEGIKLSYMPFFIRALSMTIKRFPTINASVDLADKTLVVHRHYNIGIAFKTPAGVIAPVLKNVQDKSLKEIIRSYEELKNKAISGKLGLADMKESTITLSNFGTLGGLWATPIINYPEVAILGVAKIHKEPAVVNDAIVIRETLNLSWSFDHRIIDGDTAAEVSNYMMSLLKNPAEML